MTFQKAPKSIFKIVLFFIVFVFVAVPMSAQNDTLYYDANWKPTVKDSASFYRPPIKKEGELYRVQDYFISGTLQMNGLSRNAEKDVWQGEVTWYNEDGTIHQQGNYTNGKLNGQFVTLLADKQLFAEYKNSRFVSGQQNISCGGGMYLYTRQKGDTIIATMYGEDIKGLRYETYRIKDSKKGDLFTKYFASDGSYLGKRTINEKGYVDGIEVDYYRNPMRIREVRTYDLNGYVSASDYYYPNGQLREEFEEKPTLKRTYFTQEGEIKGELFYQLKRGKLKAWNGRQYYFYFNYDNDKQGLIQTIRDYKDGQVTYEELRYKSQVVKSKTYFKNGGKEKLVSFDESGKEIGSVAYDNYMPINGIEVIGDRKSTYEDRVLVAETNYYPKTKIKFSEKVDEIQTYYDKEGNVLGVLEYDNSNNYPKPFEGKKFTVSYEGEISAIEEYKNGFVTKRTSFRKRLIDEKENVTFKRIETFEENGYDKIKEVFFYSNGNKQSEIEYEQYNKTYGTYYDKDGKLLGAYDYMKKEGVLYEFFADSDELQLMEERKEAKVIKSKLYTYGPNRKYGGIDPVLIEDIDVDCCAKFYAVEGYLLAECTFKDQKVWEGTLYDTSERKKYTIAEGKRNGPYWKYDYNKTVLEEGQFKEDKEQGLFKYFDYSGNLVRIENFQNGVLNGEIIYYDTDGKILAKLISEKGKPMEGTRMFKPYGGYKPTKEIYKAGLLVERLEDTKNGKQVTQFENGVEKNTIAYYPESDKKRLTYSVENGYLNGMVINYDLNGKEKYSALFEKGNLKKGTVYLTGDNIKGGASFIILKRETDTLSVQIVGKDDKILFTATENLAFGTSTVFLQNLSIYTDYLVPSRLY